MDAYGYQAGAELDNTGPDSQTSCHYCGGQILALSPAYYASGLGESVAEAIEQLLEDQTTN